MGDWPAVLRREFHAEEGSYLLQIRTEAAWDRESFRRLTEAMEACCRAAAGQGLLERWQAEGFWFLSQGVRVWTKDWTLPLSEYKEAAYQYLDDLAYWFFFGECPWTDDGVQAKSELQRLSGLSEA